MKNIFKNILFSIATLAMGFTAMAAPFHLFNELTRGEMRILFAAEIIIYFTIICAVMLTKEKKAQRKKEPKSRISKRTQSFLDMQNQICNIDSCIENEAYTKAA